MADLGVGPAAATGLGALSVVERAALVASDVERLSVLDVGHIVGRSPTATRRLLLRARGRFLDTVSEEMQEVAVPPGPMARLIDEVAARTVAPVHAP